MHRRSFVAASVLAVLAPRTLARPQAHVDLKLWTLLSGGDGARMRALIDEFNATQRGVRVVRTSLKWGEPVVTVTISLMAACAFSQLRFRGRQVLFGLAMLAFRLPFEALLVPLFRNMNQLGMINSYPGLVLPQVVPPVVIYVFKQFLDQIPAHFREAAVMDRAKPLRVLWSVYPPLSGNIVWAMAVVTFIGAWNNFLWPFIIVTSNELMTVPLGLTQTYDAFGVRYAQLMAAALIGALPVALAYVVFQRRVTQGFLAASGLKG